MSDTFPTAYAELNIVLGELIGSAQETLGDLFIGAYLQGSFALGDYDHHSDVDFIIVLEEALPEGEVHALQEMHARIYDLNSRWGQHLEGSYFPKGVLRHDSQRDRKLWYLDNGARSLVKSTHCNTIVVRWVVREYGVTLAGPAPDTLIEQIPVEKLREEILETITAWGQEILDEPQRYNNRFYQGFIVLNFCRMLHDLRAGTTSSKRVGAEWAKRHLDPIWSDLIDRAWDGRPNPALSVRPPADHQDFEDTLKFVQYIMSRAVELLGSGK